MLSYNVALLCVLAVADAVAVLLLQLEGWVGHCCPAPWVLAGGGVASPGLQLSCALAYRRGCVKLYKHTESIKNSSFSPLTV